MKGELRIKNKTEWQTRDLRKIFAAVLRVNKKTEGPLRHKLAVRVVPSRDTRVSGYAYLHSGLMHLRLPRPKNKPDLDPILVGWLFDHELAHCRGHVHKVMGRLNTAASANPQEYPHLAGLGLAPVAPPVRPTLDDRRAARRARLVARLAAWEAKEARARRAVAKCRKALQRLDRATQ